MHRDWNESENFLRVCVDVEAVSALEILFYNNFLTGIATKKKCKLCADRPKFRGSCAPKRWTEMTAKMEVTRKRMTRVEDTGTSAAVWE